MKRFYIFLGLILTILTGMTVLSSYNWFFDLATHFTIQYTLALILCLIIGVIVEKQRIFLFLLVPALAVNLYFLTPYFLNTSILFGAPEERLRVAAINVSTHNYNYERVIDYLLQKEADVVYVSEAEPELMLAVNERISDLYPYVHDASSPGTRGMALLSRYPFDESQTINTGNRRRQLIQAVINWQGTPVYLFGVHPYPPLSPTWAARRNDELVQITQFVQETPRPLILLGDFNAAPWSHPMRELEQETRLRNAALGRGIRPTWGLTSVAWGAPIDHIMISSDWQVLNHEIRGNIGSDHMPVLADLALR